MLASAIFLAPLNLFIKWGESHAYVGGIFSDYLVNKLWLAEIPVLLIAVWWLPKKIIANRQKIIQFAKKYWWLFLGLLIFVARQFFSILPTASWWYLLKVIELLIFAACLKEILPKVDRRLIEYVLLITVIFQFGVGLLQFINQQPLFDYHILGETQFTGSINVAKASFTDGETSLAYGTTAHPNILAGVVTILGLLWLEIRLLANKKPQWLELVVVAIIAVTLFITQSYSALLATSLFLLIKTFPSVAKQPKPLAWSIGLLIPLLLIFLTTQTNDQSIFRRAFLNAHAVSLVAEQPLFGTGLNNFTTTLDQVTHPELVRFIQPAHNVFLLILAETGLLGLLLIWQALRAGRLIIPTAWLVLLITLLSLDHYLVTQWVGGVLLALAVIINHRHQDQ